MVQFPIPIFYDMFDIFIYNFRFCLLDALADLLRNVKNLVNPYVQYAPSETMSFTWKYICCVIMLLDSLIFQQR